MKDFVTSHIRQYHEYIPGEQSRQKIIKLNANENHLSPHPKIKEYLKIFSIKKLNYYPDPNCRELEIVVRKSYRLKKNIGLVFGNGADEIIRGIFKTFFIPHKDSVLLTEVTYPGYKTYAELEGITLEYLPVNKDFSVSFKGLKKSRSRVFFLTNPNNPTGMMVKSKVIMNMIQDHPNKLFVIDEAYVAFSGDSCLSLLPQPNLIVIRTASKSFSACGLRLGFGAANLDHAHCIRKVLDPYNLNVITLSLGKIIFSNLAYMKKNSEKVVEIREWFHNELEKLNFFVFPSKANFLLVKPFQVDNNQNTAKLLFEFLKKNKIFVRYFTNPILAEYIRITIGSKKDLLKLLSQIKKFYSFKKG